MLFTAGVSSNMCLGLSRWLGEGCDWMVALFSNTCISAFPAFGRTPGLDVGVWREDLRDETLTAMTLCTSMILASGLES